MTWANSPRVSFSLDTYWLLADRDGKFCHYCGVHVRFRGEPEKGRPFTGEVAHIDHKTPLVAGGRNSLSNLVLACEHCNRSKGSKPYGPWKQMWDDAREHNRRIHWFERVVVCEDPVYPGDCRSPGLSFTCMAMAR